MVRQYGVSRESLREGLRLLEAQGLITIRRGPGGGPVVGPVDPAHLGRTSALYYRLAGATYGELFAAWAGAETTIADLAARNPNRVEVQAAMARSRIPSDDCGSAAEFVASRAAFHTALGALVENRVTRLSLMAIGPTVTRHLSTDFDPRRLATVVDHDHGEIAQAVAAGHPGKARDVMAAHIETIVAAYRRELDPRMDATIEWR